MSSSVTHSQRTGRRQRVANWRQISLYLQLQESVGWGLYDQSGACLLQKG